MFFFCYYFDIYLYFGIFMADEVKICQKLVPLMFPNMIRIHIYICMMITRDKFPTSEKRKKNLVKNFIKEHNYFILYLSKENSTTLRRALASKLSTPAVPSFLYSMQNHCKILIQAVMR